VRGEDVLGGMLHGFNWLHLLHQPASIVSTRKDKTILVQKQHGSKRQHSNCTNLIKTREWTMPATHATGTAAARRDSLADSGVHSTCMVWVRSVCCVGPGYNRNAKQPWRN
jgi:hypothetical protein